MHFEPVDLEENFIDKSNERQNKYNAIKQTVTTKT